MLHSISKYLWKCWATVLCGPVGNDTRMPLVAIRSPAGTQFPRRLVSEARGAGAVGPPPPPPGSWRVWRRAPAPAFGSPSQLCWCCQPHWPLPHLLCSPQRINTPEERIRSSAGSFTFDLLNYHAVMLSIDWIWRFYYHTGRGVQLLLKDHLNDAFSSWDVQVFGLSRQRQGWRLNRAMLCWVWKRRSINIKQNVKARPPPPPP